MNIDLFPTILEVAGGSLPANRQIDGLNILGTLRNGKPSPHKALFLFDGDRIAGVRSGRWKLVVESKFGQALVRLGHKNSYYGQGLLFDLERDPSETYSFTREYPEVVRDLTEYLREGEEKLSATVLKRMWNFPGR